MMKHLISVTIPCYNSVATLSLALASLLAQTYENWECILVDDGSTDHPEAVVAQINDPRIRCIRLDQNRGRGVARQVALDHAQGDYLAMLDADDWIYPNKLQQQLQVMEDAPGLTLVSTGMAIVNFEDEMVGVRTTGLSNERAACVSQLTKLTPPPVAHAPSMIRMDKAKQANYDPTFHRSQDADFLLKVLLDQTYSVLPDITYVYTEHASTTPAKILGGYTNRMRMFWKYRRHYPLAAVSNIGQTGAKWLLYRAAFSLGVGHRLIAGRSRPPTAQEVAAFNQARRAVLSVAQRYFSPEQLPLSAAPNPVE